jgi:hypothetical protein
VIGSADKKAAHVSCTSQTRCPFAYPPRLFTITFCRSSIAACGHNARAVSYAARATAKLSGAAIIRSPLGATSTILNSSSMHRHEQNRNAESSLPLSVPPLPRAFCLQFHAEHIKNMPSENSLCISGGTGRPPLYRRDLIYCRLLICRHTRQVGETPNGRKCLQPSRKDSAD